MDLEKIRTEFNEILESKINKIDFNLLTSSIEFLIEYIENGNKINTHIIFMNVSSYFFVNDTREDRKSFIEYEDGNYLEITSIDVIEGNLEIQPKAQARWIEQYGASANIAIEIWNRILLIEASKIIIGEKEFNLLPN